jgi:hypothetical protein
MSKFMNICLVEDEFFHSGGQIAGQTDMMKLTVAFRNFANSPKKKVTPSDII